MDKGAGGFSPWDYRELDTTKFILEPQKETGLIDNPDFNLLTHDGFLTSRTIYYETVFTISLFCFKPLS